MSFSRRRGLNKNIGKGIPASHYYLLGALLFFFFHFAIWPLVWHGVILPHARPDKHQLRVESYAPHRVDNTFLFLDKPDSTLTAYAVWQIPKEGFYNIRLSCDDNGKVLIDNRPVITLIGISPRNIGETKQWLLPGPHFLELRLNNILGEGWLKIEMAGPGQDSYENLKREQISWLELGNIETWLDIVFWGKSFSLLGFLGFILLGVRFYFHRWIRIFLLKKDAEKTGVAEKPIPSYFLLWISLFFFLFHFAIWPLIWHLVILPHTRPEKHQLKIESYSPHRVVNTTLFLDNPDSSLSAYAVWQVPKNGLYQIKLSCGGSGKILIDSRPVITMKGIHSFNVEEAKTWLAPGPHFLELRLTNNIEKGWLRIEVAEPGQTNYSPLNSNELSFLEFGNIGNWLGAVFWGEYLCFLGFLVLGLLWLGLFYFRRWVGRIFPTLGWGDFFLILTLFTLILSIIFYTKHPIPPIYGDGIGYYSYLPSYLIYHDPTIESIFQPVSLYDYHCGGEFERYPTTGKYLVWFPIGTAVLMLPFFLIGHIVAPLLGSAPDGFSIVYQFAIIAAAIFYMLFGLILIFKILIRHFSSKIVTVTLLSLFLGTNLLAYGSLGSSMSHIYSFFLVCLLLYIVSRWYADPSRGNTFLVGTAAGLIFLVRNPNALFLLFIPLYGIISRDTLRERFGFLWQKKKKVFFMLSWAILLFSPQVVILWITTNQLLFNPYKIFGGRFYFLSPHIVKVLFSPYHGLFIWSPILIFSVLGLWKMEGPLKLYRLPIIVCLLLHLYLVSCWADYFFGSSFGHRAFVDALGMFALPLAAFWGNLRTTIIKRGVIIISTFFIALTFYCFIQCFQGGPSPMTWPQYKTTLLNPDGFIELWQWMNNPQFNNYRLLK